jgi:uncharacterized protein (TIGR03435 family)
MNTFGLAFTSALVDFVWQGALVGFTLLIGLRTVGRRSAQVRYALCALALAALMAFPVITTLSRFEHVEPDSGVRVPVVPSLVSGSVEQPMVETLPWRAVAPSLARIEPCVLPIWSLGVMLLSIRLVAGGITVRALRRSAQGVDDHLRERVLHLAARMGIRRTVQLVISTRSEGPGVIGWLRPMILLPPATALGLTTTQLDAVLAHELAHIRRHDYLVNILQMVAETLLFYHPAVWWVSKRLRIERELCCDDVAVGVCGDATGYARALVTMAKLQVPVMAMGSTGGSLSDRVHRLVSVTGNEPRRSAAFGVAAIAVALMSIALASVNAQREPARFEVVSVKPAAPTPGVRGFGLQFLPGGVVRGNRVPLFAMIATAYHVPWNRVEGDSDLLAERFDIDARAGASALPLEGPTLEQTLLALAPILREMLKTLLAERFKLTIHMETRDSPIYALVAGKNGPRLAPAVKDCAPTTIEEATSGKGPCGLRGGGPAGGLHLPAAELTELALGLTSFLDRPVVDRTGISGRFDIELPPWNTGAPARQETADGRDLEPQPDPNAPSLFTVLQEQLGLRLEATRGPVVYCVVDHVERPAAN